MRELCRWIAAISRWLNDSGQFRGRRTIFGGRATVRCALYMAALSAAQHAPVIKPFSDRLKAAGKPPRGVLIACTRKLLNILQATIRTDTAGAQKLHSTRSVHP